MRAFIFRKDGSSVAGSSFSGGTLTSPLILAGDPTQPLEAATKQYVDNGLAALNASNLTSGTIPVARLPAFTGDVSSSAGTNTLTLNNTGVTAGTYTKVTVDAKGRVTAGGALAASDIPNLDWSKITTGKPTTLSGYGITDGVNKSGDTMTGPLTLSGNATSPLHAVPLQQLSGLTGSDGSIEFIASGTIPNAGLTVGLNANGTVSVIALTEQPEGWGSPITFNNSSGPISPVHDPVNNKIVIAYKNSSGGVSGAAVVGTVTGNSISFGSPTIFDSGTDLSLISVTYDSANGKVIIAYRNGHGKAVVGTVSGNSISLSSPVVFNSSSDTYEISATYDSNNNKIVIAYTTPTQGRAVIGTVSGNSISFGTPVNFSSNYVYYISATYDSANGKVIIAYRRNHSDGYGSAIVGTVSGNSILFGSPVVFSSTHTSRISAIYDPNNNKIVITYITDHGVAIVGTVSGNSISFGSPVIFSNNFTYDISPIYNSNNNKIVMAYYTDHHAFVRVGTVSGNSISFGSPVIFHSGTINGVSAVYDSTNNKIVIAYRPYYDSTGEQSRIIVSSPSTVVTNKNKFIGISQNSATNGATAKVRVKGQVDSNQSGLTPGQLYYVSNNGTLTTTSTNNPLAGVAISATKLLITNWFIN